MLPRRPEELWTPAIGYVTHLRPCDMGDLTDEQYVAVIEQVNQLLIDSD